MSVPINITTVLPVVDQPNSSVRLNEANSRLFVTGSADTVDTIGAVNDVVIAVGPNDSISGYYDTGDTVLLYGQAETLSLEGNPGSNATPADANYVVMAGNQDTVSLQGTTTLDFYGSDGTITVRENAVADMPFAVGVNTINAHGVGNATVTGGGANFTFIGDSGQYSVSGGTATHSVIDGGNGGGVFIGGNTNKTIIYQGDNTITAGQGSSTLVGSAYGTSVLTAKGSAGDVLIAGEYGRDTLSGGASTGNNLLQGYLGAFTPSDDPRNPTPTAVMTAGQGNDTLVAGAGATIMTGGPGNDVFAFINDPTNQVPAQNSTTLNGFVQGQDQIDLRGFTDPASAILAAATFTGGGTTLHLQDGTTLTVSNVTLNAGDITQH